MKHSNHVSRWIAGGVGVLALSGVGTAAATTPPTEPPEDTTDTTGIGIDDTSEPLVGAGPSDCPPVTIEPVTTEPEVLEPTETTDALDAEPTETFEPTETTDALDAEPTETFEPTEPTDALDAGPAVQVAVADDGTEILVDADCNSLYVFTQDIGGEPTCVDDCALRWPPLLVEGTEVPPLADELDPSLFSVVDHPDGPQLSVADQPLYTFADDLAPGETNGQGVGGVWWLVDSDGMIVGEAEGAPTTDGITEETVTDDVDITSPETTSP